MYYTAGRERLGGKRFLAHAAILVVSIPLGDREALTGPRIGPHHLDRLTDGIWLAAVAVILADDLGGIVRVS